MDAFLVLVLLVLGSYFTYGFLGGLRGGTPAKKTIATAAPDPVLHWEGADEYEFEVVGESFYQGALRELAGDHGDRAAFAKHRATLVPDGANPHDDKAVRVDIGGYVVGHLSRADARKFRRRLSAKKIGSAVTTCDAAIVGGGIRDGERLSYGVRLDIRPFDY